MSFTNLISIVLSLNNRSYLCWAEVKQAVSLYLLLYHDSRDIPNTKLNPSNSLIKQP